MEDASDSMRSPRQHASDTPQERAKAETDVSAAEGAPASEKAAGEADVSPAQQPPHCDASEEQRHGSRQPADTSGPLLLSRSASAGANPRSSSSGTIMSLLPMHGSSFSQSMSSFNVAASSGSGSSSELVYQLQRLCSRQRMRSEERHFVRDVERVLALLRQQQQVSSASRSRATSSSSVTSSAIASGAAVQDAQDAVDVLIYDGSDTRAHSASVSSTISSSSSAFPYYHQPSTGSLTLAEIELLFDCIADLFGHRNYDVRAVVFETVTLCMNHYGHLLSSELRLKIFRQLEDHPAGDFTLRQRALRVLTQDGRNLEPFHIELGWLLLRLLDESDEQRDLLGLIQNIFRRSPLVLDFENVVTITNVVCSRCDLAWTRGDIESCKKYLTFFHVLATHNLEHAASTSVSLRTLCCMVNADGHGTWSIMKHLLNGAAGFQVLRGLIDLLENPYVSTQWVLRGAVFFVGMSCWGSQRVGKFEDVKWAPVLLSMERVLKCNNGVVIFEVILAMQRLVKKFGASKSNEIDAKNSHSSSSTSARDSERKLFVEWDIILRMFRELRPWLSLHDGDGDSDDGEISNMPSMMTHHPHHNSTSSTTSSTIGGLEPPQVSVSIHQTRIPRELLDTLNFVEELVAQKKFAGEVDDFFDVLEDYLPHLNEGSTLFLLRHRVDTSHPAHHGEWLQTLRDTMRTFFSNGAMFGAVRLEALEALHANLHVSRNVCEDRVIEEVVLPTLGHIYNDHHAEVRRRGLDFITEVARLVESVKFEPLLSVLADAVTLSLYEDAQVLASSGIVSLFSSYFNHMPPARSLRMYELITKMVETHRNRDVRKIALSCLLHMCQADSEFRLQWKDNQVRTSRFLFCSKHAVRNPQTGACVPVALGMRAMVTLVSTETHADLFRMAVSGIQTMLENRIVLTDVDISDMALKILSSIEYRAFGRAAVPDELTRIIEEMKGPSQDDDHATEDASRHTGWEVLSRRNTESDMLRYLTTKRHTGGDARMGSSFKSNLRDTVALLCKTKFMTMGLELVALLISYASELNGTARRHLITCLVDALAMQLNVADKDVAGIGLSVTGSLHRARSAASLTRASTYDEIASESGGKGIAAQAVDQLVPSSSYHHPSQIVAKVASPYIVGGFTSRVFSRFQASSSGSLSQGNLFHAFASSSTVKPMRGGARPDNAADDQDHGFIQQSLHALYTAEFTMLHISTNMLSLLALRMPDEMLAQMETVFHSARLCFSTLDGDFRADAFGAALEMIGNIVYCLPTMPSHHYVAVIETLLIGFEQTNTQSKQLSYMAFRLLCHVIFKCAPRDRIPLASVALPRLQQLFVRTNSLLVEAAIDFLMSFAYSRSFTPPPALCNPSISTEKDADVVLQSRSWVFNNSLLTIQVFKQGCAKLVIRRANGTNHWDLRISREYLLDPAAIRPKEMGSSSGQVEKRVRTPGLKEKDTVEVASAPLLGERDPRSSAASGSQLVSSVDSQKPTNDDSLEEIDGGLPAEEKSEHAPPSPLPLTTVTTTASIPTTTQAAQALTTEVTPKAQPESSPNALEKQAKAAHGNLRKQVAFALDGNSPVAFPHPSASLPPLPAYDGIGGSPSYFCEANPGTYRQRNNGLYRSSFNRRRRSSNPRNASIREHEDDRALSSDSYSDQVSHLDDDDGPDDFSLDGSALDRSDASDRNNIDRRRPGTGEDTSNKDGQQESLTADPDSPDAIGSAGSSDALDPMYLMMQLFDLTVENRPHLLLDGDALSLGLNVLDRTPEYETHKIGLLYVQHPKQRMEREILGNRGGSVRYLRFLRGLGTFTKLQGLRGYTGGLDTANDSDGKFGLIYVDNSTQIMFHVATMMGSDSTQSGNGPDAMKALTMSKKRHIGNDFVHVIYKECDEDYNVSTFSGQFNDVHIIVQPLNDKEYRTQVHAKPGIKPFGPLYGTQIVSSSIIAECVRLTCLNANLACQTFHQDLVGFAMNCEDRLKQIKQLGIRLATPEDWKLD
ncbi:hypothetical protein FI667_g13437, partial [Globisporangium splendens]